MTPKLSKLEIKKRKMMKQRRMLQEEDKIELAEAGFITLCQLCGRHYVLTDRGKEIIRAEHQLMQQTELPEITDKTTTRKKWFGLI